MITVNIRINVLKVKQYCALCTISETIFTLLGVK